MVARATICETAKAGSKRVCASKPEVLKKDDLRNQAIIQTEQKLNERV